MEIICEEVAGYIVEYKNPFNYCDEQEHLKTEEEMLAFCEKLTESYSVFKIIRCIIE